MDTEKALDLLSNATYHGQPFVPVEAKQVRDGVLLVIATGFVLVVFEKSKVSPSAKAKQKWADTTLNPIGWDGFGFLPTALPLTASFSQVTVYLTDYLVTPKGAVLRWFDEPVRVAFLQATIQFPVVPVAHKSAAAPAAPASKMHESQQMAMAVPDLATPPPKKASAGDPTVVAPSGSAKSTLPPLRTSGQTK